MLEYLDDGIFRLCVPFEQVYTTVFLLRAQERWILMDGAASAEDAVQYVLPVLAAENISPEFILRSHHHGDHAGGIPRIAAAFPDAKVGLIPDGRHECGAYFPLADGDVLLGRFQVLNLKGHTDNGLALLDLQTRILISADCLQAGGIGKYGVSFTDRAAYLQSVERVRALQIDRIITSHDYAPYGFQAVGRTAVEAFLNECAQVAGA